MKFVNTAYHMTKDIKFNLYLSIDELSKDENLAN